MSFRTKRATLVFLFSGLAATLVAGTIPDGFRGKKVEVPRTWLTAREALELAYRQTRLRYAVVPPKFEGLLGPFSAGGTIPLDKLINQIAEAAGATVRVVGDVVVFDPPTSPKVEPASDSRQQVLRLALAGHSRTISPLCRLLAHDDASIRFHALAALHRMEGDFMRNTWPGRVSIFEVLREEMDRDALFFMLEEGDCVGGRQWTMAMEILGRARNPYLVRFGWSPIWEKVPGTIAVAVWAMGRSGDADGRNSISKRLRQHFTNDSTDRYLAALALGELSEGGELRKHFEHANPDVRRAAVLGLGLCSESPALLAALDTALKDADPVVRFIACQSLGRIATPTAINRLKELAESQAQPSDVRCAALEGLRLACTRTAAAGILVAASDANPAVKARAAELLGESVGAGARAKLLELLKDSDRWVRAAAAYSLGLIGDEQAVDAVSAYIRNKDMDTDGIIAALIGLGRGHSPRAATVASEIALDASRPVRLRYYAVLCLAQLAHRAGQGTLKLLATYGTNVYLHFALRHVELATPDKTARFVAQYLARGDRNTAGAAACRLAELGTGWGVRELLEGSDVFDNQARMMHMWGAIRAEGPEVIPALVEAAHSRRAAIREGAALALGNRLDVRAVDALRELTRDPSARVRSAAAQSLGLTGDPAALPDLLRLAEKDENTEVADAAIRAFRMRAYSHRPEVRELFARLRGTPRDCGVIDPDRPALAEQPNHSFVLRRWPYALEDNDMCNITYETSLTYDSVKRRIVLWGSHGRRADSPQTGETWFYSAAQNDWDRLTDSRELPNGTCCVWGMTFDPANRCAVTPVAGGRGGHGWLNHLRAGMQYSVPWVLDVRTDQWYPMKPADHKGSLGALPGSYDPARGLLLWWFNKVAAYDVRANDWTMLSKSGEGPSGVNNTGGQVDPLTGRFIIVAGGSTWAFDPATRTWTDLKPAGPQAPEGCRMVYDSANDVMLLFEASRSKPVAVWVYHVRENRWEALPSVYPAPRYGTFDVAYDAANNVTVISGGWSSGRSGETTIRETWTYRYRPAVPKPPEGSGRPRDLQVLTAGDGSATLSWKHPEGKAPKQYRVERGTGAKVWEAHWTSLETVPGTQTSYKDAKPDTTNPCFYRVVPLDESGKEGLPSTPIVAAPPAPRWATAVASAEGIRLKWEAVGTGDVMGYHVYRAPVSACSYWTKNFDPLDLAGQFQRITQEPIKEAELLDRAARVTETTCEFSWPDSYAYIVRPVNAWGREGGASPTTLALPDPPGPVRVIPWLDGKRLILWPASRGRPLRGYCLMRMDDWNGAYVFRWHAAPIMVHGFWDAVDFPTADRRKYFVSGVDPLGAVGIPSSDVWSHGFP